MKKVVPFVASATKVIVPKTLSLSNSALVEICDLNRWFKATRLYQIFNDIFMFGEAFVILLNDNLPFLVSL